MHAFAGYVCQHKSQLAAAQFQKVVVVSTDAPGLETSPRAFERLRDPVRSEEAVCSEPLSQSPFPAWCGARLPTSRRCLRPDGNYPAPCPPGWLPKPAGAYLRRNMVLLTTEVRAPEAQPDGRRGPGSAPGSRNGAAPAPPSRRRSRDPPEAVPKVHPDGPVSPAEATTKESFSAPAARPRPRRPIRGHWPPDRQPEMPVGERR